MNLRHTKNGAIFWATLYAIARYNYAISRPSFCLSVCHTGGSVKNVWS